MGFAFNPFTGNFDVKGAGGGGGSAFFAGEVPTYADLPLDGTAALNSRWLVRSNSGTWPFSSYKQAGVYVRIATVGSSRDNDYRLTDTSFFDVMSDSAFLLYDDGDATKNLKFQLSGIDTATTRTISVPDNDVTLPDQGTSTTDTPTFEGATINQSGTWGLTVDSGATETNTADFTGNSTNYNLLRVQNTSGGSSFYMACTGSGYSGSNFGESNAGQVSLEVNGGGTNYVGLIGNRHGPLCLGADDQIQLRLDSNGTTISDPADITKKVRLSAASVTAGQTRVVTFPDKNITLDDTGDTRPPASHTHELTALAATGATNGHVLTANGSGGVTFAAASGGGVTSVTGTAPIVSSGGTTPAISVTVGTGANTVAAGDDSRFHTRSHAMTGTSDHTAGNWSVFYSNGSGQVTELALGAANTVLTSNGASSAPSFAAASGGGSSIMQSIAVGFVLN